MSTSRIVSLLALACVLVAAAGAAVEAAASMRLHFPPSASGTVHRGVWRSSKSSSSSSSLAARGAGTKNTGLFVFNIQNSLTFDPLNRTSLPSPTKGKWQTSPPESIPALADTEDGIVPGFAGVLERENFFGNVSYRNAEIGLNYSIIATPGTPPTYLVDWSLTMYDVPNGLTFALMESHVEGVAQVFTQQVEPYTGCATPPSPPTPAPPPSPVYAGYNYNQKYSLPNYGGAPSSEEQ